MLFRSYEKMGKNEDATKMFERLKAEHPQSPFLAEIPERRAQT